MILWIQKTLVSPFYLQEFILYTTDACLPFSLTEWVIKPTSLEDVTITKISMANNRILFLIRSMSVMGWAFGCAIYTLCWREAAFDEFCESPKDFTIYPDCMEDAVMGSYLQGLHYDLLLLLF